MNQQYLWIKYPNFSHPDFEETQFSIVQAGLLAQILNQLQGKTSGIVRFTGCRGIDIDRALVELTSYIRHAHIEHTSSKGRTYVVQGSYRVTLVNSLIFPETVPIDKIENKKENKTLDKRDNRPTSTTSLLLPEGSTSNLSTPDVRAQETVSYQDECIQDWDQGTGQETSLLSGNAFKKWVRESGKSEQDVRELILSSLNRIHELAPDSRIPQIGIWFKYGYYEMSMTNLTKKTKAKVGVPPLKENYKEEIYKCPGSANLEDLVAEEEARKMAEAAEKILKEQEI